MCFVNGCSTPDWVPPDKSCLWRGKGDEKRGSQKCEVERCRTSPLGKQDGVGKMSAVELRRGLRWRSETKAMSEEI